MIPRFTDVPQEVRPFLTTLIEQCQCHLGATATVYVVGSYATRTYTPTSDVDLLVQYPQKHTLVKHLTHVLPQTFPVWYAKLDCKILTPQDLTRARHDQYLILYSMLTSSQLLTGIPISLSYSLPNLKRSYRKWVTLLHRLEQVVETQAQVNTQVLASTLWSVGKSLSYIWMYVTSTEKPVSTIFTADYDFLKTHYDQQRAQAAPITVTLTQSIYLSVSRRRHMPVSVHRRFRRSLRQLREVERELVDLF